MNGGSWLSGIFVRATWAAVRGWGRPCRTGAGRSGGVISSRGDEANRLACDRGHGEEVAVVGEDRQSVPFGCRADGGGPLVRRSGGGPSR